MRSKYTFFLVIAIYFIFSYPVITRTLNLNYSLGWYQRDWQTFLLPLWFFFIFLTYLKLSLRNIFISNYFFWFHVLITLIPSFFFNYPFIKINTEGASIEVMLNKIERVYQAFIIYFIVQILLYLFLLVKLLRR